MSVVLIMERALPSSFAEELVYYHPLTCVSIFLFIKHHNRELSLRPWSPGYTVQPVFI